MEINVTDQNFKEEVLEKSKTKPVLVDFWATWCPPCKMLGPIIEQISKEMEKKLVVAKADTANCPKISAEYGILSIPALKIFKNGKVIAQMVGYVPKSALIDWINESL